MLIIDHTNTILAGAYVAIEDRQIIADEVAEIQANMENAIPYNYALVGSIEHEYALFKCNKVLENLALNLADEYIKNSPNLKIDYSNKKTKLEIGDCWVNFQKKYEYNPLHNHGGIFSFVIWIQIPYNLEDEEKLFASKRVQTASKFGFYFPSPFGSVQSLLMPIDKTWEWRMVLFPADLHHIVYPFYTSDDYRISISGNLYLA